MERSPRRWTRRQMETREDASRALARRILADAHGGHERIDLINILQGFEGTWRTSAELSQLTDVLYALHAAGIVHAEGADNDALTGRLDHVDKLALYAVETGRRRV